MTRETQTSSYFAEHLGVISALEENFTAADDDFASLQAIHDIYDTLVDTARQKESHAKHLVAGLVKECEEREREARYPRPEQEHADLVGSMRGKVNAASTQVYSMESQIEALEQQEQEIGARMNELVAVWNELMEKERVEPRLRNLIALYVNVTGITWDLKTVGGERVKGRIDVPDAGVLEDVACDGDFDGVNAIWERLAAAQTHSGL
jgi:polyhydroxyalkanoate synthesis regulator phasin